MEMKIPPILTYNTGPLTNWSSIVSLGILNRLLYFKLVYRGTNKTYYTLSTGRLPDGTHVASLSNPDNRRLNLF